MSEELAKRSVAGEGEGAPAAAAPAAAAPAAAAPAAAAPPQPPQALAPGYQPEYPFFTHADCPHFPCHSGLAPEEFNCAFCYCPLYALGAECGGDFRITKKGVKDCTPCSKPHRGTDGIHMVRALWPRLRDLTRERLGAREGAAGTAAEAASAAGTAAEAPAAEGGARV